MASARALLITFEGGDGVGKSTQLRLLAERLRATGRAVVTTREPGGTPRAERIREALLAGRARDHGPLAEAALFAAARADHVARLIRPSLERGVTVLCDRFVDSTRVYQGSVGAVPAAQLAILERAATHGLRPDLTLVLDLPAGLAALRASARRTGEGEADRFEGEGDAYRTAVAAAFRALAAAEPERCVLVAASGDADLVASRIWAAVAPRLDMEGAARG